MVWGLGVVGLDLLACLFGVLVCVCCVQFDRLVLVLVRVISFNSVVFGW